MILFKSLVYCHKVYFLIVNEFFVRLQPTLTEAKSIRSCTLVVQLLTKVYFKDLIR